MTKRKPIDHAIKLLSKRDYSQHGLSVKLKETYPLHEILAMMPHLIETGFLNDARFAEQFIYSRRNKGYGPKRIKTELEMHGISKEIIAEQLNITDNAWLVEAEKVWRKKFKGNYPQNIKLRAKQMHFLYYRGFTEEQIESIIPKKIDYHYEL